jgi:hypothetical protein
MDLGIRGNGLFGGRGALAVVCRLMLPEKQGLPRFLCQELFEHEPMQLELQQQFRDMQADRLLEFRVERQ